MTEPTLNYVYCPDGNAGHRMAYWQWGSPESAHVVLCVHGLSRQGRDFDVLAEALCEAGKNIAGGIRVVCPDVVGRGASDWLQEPMGYQVPTYATDMLTLLAQLHKQSSITTLDWVGTSMGGLIGIAICGQPDLGGASHPAKLATSLDSAAVPSGKLFLPVAVRRLVLNDVGPTIEWQALVRISTYLGQSGQFDSVQQAADAMWAISTGFGPHTPQQWLALSRHMVKPVSGADSRLRLHYDPAIALPFKQATEASTLQSEAILWHLYGQITARTLLLRGMRSDLLSPETAQAMTQRGPHARLVEFAGVGHAPTLIANDQVAAVTGFLLE